ISPTPAAPRASNTRFARCHPKIALLVQHSSDLQRFTALDPLPSAPARGRSLIGATTLWGAFAAEAAECNNTLSLWLYRAASSGGEPIRRFYACRGSRAVLFQGAYTLECGATPHDLPGHDCG